MPNFVQLDDEIHNKKSIQKMLLTGVRDSTQKKGLPESGNPFNFCNVRYLYFAINIH
jgi:hypothetical protein